MARHGLTKLARTAEIVGLLYEHQFFDVMKRIARAPRVQVGPGRWDVDIPEDAPRRIRLLMEELGPTFIKMGQLLATRPDLIPKQFVEEFRNFYDRTRATPFAEVKALVEAELGKPLEEVFTKFEEQPIASASIGQVHAAWLRTGEKVAVKVQHPGIEATVATDFAIMRPLVRFFENLFAASRLYQPSGHLREIEHMLRTELDYTSEARTLGHFHRNFADDPEVHIPLVYHAFTTRRVLVMEFIDGLPLSQATPEKLRELGWDPRPVARILTRAMAKMIFVDRLFHADPSPGNLILVGPNQVAFIDFGAVGHVSRRRATHVMHLVHGFNTEDLDEITTALLELCNILGPVDPQQLKKDVERIMEYASLDRAAVGDPVVMDLIAKTATNNHMMLPADFFLVSRSLFQFEGVCNRLDPDYDIVREFTPVVARLLGGQVLGAGGRALAKEVGLAYLELARDLPSRLNNLLRKMETNQLELRVHPVHTEEVVREERRHIRRSFTTILSALIVGSGLTFLNPSGQAFGQFLFFGAVFALLWAIVMLYYSE